MIGRTSLAILAAVYLVAHSLMAGPANAQDFQPLIYSREEIPFSNVENPPADSLQEDLKVRVTTEKIVANLPLAFNEKRSVFLISLARERVLFQYRNLDPDFTDNAVNELYTQSFLLTYIQKWSEKYSTVALVSTNRSADLKTPPPSTRKTLGGLILQNKVSETEKYGFGAVIVDITGETQIFPVLQYFYTGSNMKVQIDLPSKANVQFNITAALKVGAFAQISGAQYEIRDERRAFDELKYSVWRYGWEVIVIGKPGLQVGFGMGQTISRRYEGFADGRRLGNLDLEDSEFTRVTVGVVF